jgi:hypothetical protein
VACSRFLRHSYRHYGADIHAQKIKT